MNLFKILQMVRLLSRDGKNIVGQLMTEVKSLLEILSEILSDSAAKLNSHAEDGVDDNASVNTAASISIEVLRILKRLCGGKEMFEHRRLFTNAIDLISVNNSLLLKTLLDFL